ncbi:MAG: cupin domain-containing protein [Salinivirgaceae bacterium]|nr:cupin domain-containing protein [Salinivirgaceae bacterium]MDD4748027.1 cupin domain-containing protein [Salinivirgaceae bacterium]
MNIVNLQNAQKVPFDLDGRILFTSPKAEIIHLHLKAGEVLAKHTNPFDVAIYIVEGNGIIETDETINEVSANDTISIAAGLNRGLTNSGNSDLRVLVFKIF